MPQERFKDGKKLNIHLIILYTKFTKTVAQSNITWVATIKVNENWELR